MHVLFKFSFDCFSDIFETSLISLLGLSNLSLIHLFQLNVHHVDNLLPKRQIFRGKVFFCKSISLFLAAHGGTHEREREENM